MEHIADSIRAGDVRAVQQAVNELLDRNAQPPLTPDGKTWLHVACEAGEANIVQLLLAHDGMFAVVDQDANGNTPAHLVSGPAADQIIQKLFMAGANLDAVAHDGLTPLLRASEAGVASAVRALLASHASPDAQHGVSGYRALHYAAAGCHAEAVELLLGEYVRRGAGDEVNRRTPELFGHRSPLHLACRPGGLDTARLLLAHGADPNSIDGANDTPLVVACKRGVVDVVELLLRHPRLDVQARVGLDGRPMFEELCIAMAKEHGRKEERLIHVAGQSEAAERRAAEAMERAEAAERRAAEIEQRLRAECEELEQRLRAECEELERRLTLIRREAEDRIHMAARQLDEKAAVVRAAEQGRQEAEQRAAAAEAERARSAAEKREAEARAQAAHAALRTAEAKQAEDSVGVRRAAEQRLEEAQRELQLSQEARRAAVQQVEALQAQLAQLTKSLTASQNDLQAARERTARAVAASEASAERAAAAERQLAELQDSTGLHVARLQDEIHSHLRERTTLAAELEFANQKADNICSRANKLQEQLIEVTTDAATAKATLQSMEKVHERGLQQAQRAHQQAQQQVLALAANEERLREQLRKVTESLAAHEAEERQLREQLQRAKQDASERAAARQAAERQLQEQVEKVAEVRAALDAHLAQAPQRESAERQREAAERQLRAQLQKATQAVEALETEKRQLREQLQRATQAPAPAHDDAAVAKLNAQLKAANALVEDLHASQAYSDDQLEKTRRALIDAKSELAAQTHKVGSLEGDCERLKARVRELERRSGTDMMLDEFRALQDRLADAERTLAAARAAAEQQAAARAMALRALKPLQRQLAELQLQAASAACAHSPHCLDRARAAQASKLQPAQPLAATLPEDWLARSAEGECVLRLPSSVAGAREAETWVVERTPHHHNGARSAVLRVKQAGLPDGLECVARIAALTQAQDGGAVDLLPRLRPHPHIVPVLSHAVGAADNVRVLPVPSARLSTRCVSVTIMPRLVPLATYRCTLGHPLQEAEVLVVLLQVLLAVLELQRLGLAHCDIRPEHVLLEAPQPGDAAVGARVRAVLTGLGSVRWFARADGTPHAVQQADRSAGESFFRAPEIASAKPGGDVRAAFGGADVYATGSMAALMLADDPHGAEQSGPQRLTYTRAGPLSPGMRQLLARLVAPVTERPSVKEAILLASELLFGGAVRTPRCALEGGSALNALLRAEVLAVQHSLVPARLLQQEALLSVSGRRGPQRARAVELRSSDSAGEEEEEEEDGVIAASPAGSFASASMDASYEFVPSDVPPDAAAAAAAGRGTRAAVAASARGAAAAAAAAPSEAETALLADLSAVERLLGRCLAVTDGETEPSPADDSFAALQELAGRPGLAADAALVAAAIALPTAARIWSVTERVQRLRRARETAPDPVRALLCWLLGECAFRGVGAAYDVQAALAWLQQAAALGHAPSQRYVALCLELGVGGARDEAEARRLRVQAATQGCSGDPPSFLDPALYRTSAGGRGGSGGSGGSGGDDGHDGSSHRDRDARDGAHRPPAAAVAAAADQHRALEQAVQLFSHSCLHSFPPGSPQAAAAAAAEAAAAPAASLPTGEAALRALHSLAGRHGELVQLAVAILTRLRDANKYGDSARRASGLCALIYADADIALLRRAADAGARAVTCLWLAFEYARMVHHGAAKSCALTQLKEEVERGLEADAQLALSHAWAMLGVSKAHAGTGASAAALAWMERSLRASVDRLPRSEAAGAEAWARHLIGVIHAAVAASAHVPHACLLSAEEVEDCIAGTTATRLGLSHAHSRQSSSGSD